MKTTLDMSKTCVNVAFDRFQPDTTRVECFDFDDEGQCYVTIFSGPQHHERASDYANWLNEQRSIG